MSFRAGGSPIAGESSRMDGHAAGGDECAVGPRRASAAVFGGVLA